MAATSVILNTLRPRLLLGPAWPAAWRDRFSSILGLVLLSGIVSAAVATVALEFPGAAPDQFGWQWVRLWAVALLTIVVFSRVAFTLANGVTPIFVRLLEIQARKREDRRFMESARLDPRLMADIDGAMRRSEWL